MFCDQIIHTQPLNTCKKTGQISRPQLRLNATALDTTSIIRRTYSEQEP